MIAARFSLFSLLAVAALRANPPPPAPPGPPPVPAALALPAIPDDEARLELARVLVYGKRYDEALVEYRLVLAVRPDDLALKAEYGQILGWAGRGPEAAAALSALPADRLPPGAALILADLLLGEKKYAEAEALYRRVLAAAPADHATRFKLARVLSWQKHYDAALAELDLILETAPDDIQVRRHRAQILGWAGRQADAVAEWRKTLPVAP